MKITARFATVAGLALATAGIGVGVGPATAATSRPDSSVHGSTVFVQTDGLTGNAVVAYDGDSAGRLTLAGTYATGGLGGQLDGSVADHTASESSLAAGPGGRLLYAVNAGSDTLSVFAVHGDRLQRTQTISSGGDFPVSVATHGHLVYVLDARDGGAIQGYQQVGDHLVAQTGEHRALGLDATATPEFTHTPGQVAFSPDGSKLLVTTKANTNAVDVFDVRAGGLSAKPVVTTLDGAVPFGIAFDARGNLAVAEAGPGAVATFGLNRDSTLTPVDTALTGQPATCWVTSVGSKLFASNAGGPTVSAYSDSGKALTSLGTTTTDAGTVDSAAAPDGHTLYVQTGGAGVVDEFHVGANGTLSEFGSITVANAVGGEGIVAL